MQLTSYTDYSLRVLIYVGSLPEGGRTSIKEIASAYQLSSNHLQKIVHDLGRKNYIETIRGRNGGIQLGLQPEKINVGTLVREMEDMALVECFNENHLCAISPVCRLKGALHKANEAFLQVLDDYTLADLLVNKDDLADIFLAEIRKR
ncbi:Rrf2 family transcriptional regulator [Salicibibacter halophilus]|uniref:HTH-type transcriptional regulator NsrR n=1 Tax=Salicibibacter halophilus TaxID=2502791 RepID=A0A514LL85_9BACI|nr:Rrf2 family transcriptional regulator [Salicibibacter halophilus]QDI92630.1 Rrf2 family transcriptional regulator [Salicibibacter halophilus]